MGILVAGMDLGGPAGLPVHTFADLGLGVAHLRNAPRAAGASVCELVLHETVSPSWSSTVAGLQARGLGVHFIVDERGTIYQHADLQDDLCWHASQHNGPSVGIEIVNPYEPALAPKGGPWVDVIEGSWAAGGKYLVPPLAQLEAVAALVDWLSSSKSCLAIPQLWPGLAGTRMALSRVPALAEPPHPGILAHTFWNHADGSMPLLFAWLLLEARLGPADARAAAMRLAAGPQTTADLSEFFQVSPDGQAGYPARPVSQEPHA